MNTGAFKFLGRMGGGGAGRSELYLVPCFPDLIASKPCFLWIPVYSPGNLIFLNVQTGKRILSYRIRKCWWGRKVVIKIQQKYENMKQKNNASHQ